MLEINNLHVSYKKDNPILKGFDLSIHKGEICGVLGMNGAGKTTLFNAIYGFTPPAQGKITLQDQALHHTHISFLETQNYFYPYMKGIEYLQLVTKGAYNPKLNQIFELPLDRLIDTYSTGMKKKLAFWAVFELERAVVILDEPFNGIDIEGVECLYNLILEMRRRGQVVLISSHVIETLTRICDRIAYLNGGKIEKTYPQALFPDLQMEIQQIIQTKVQGAFRSEG